MLNLPAISAILHYRVAQAVQERFPGAVTILDSGGTGRFKLFGPWDVTDANVSGGHDGCKLTFDDGSFDVVVSVATLEHVHSPDAFLTEALRVSRLGVAHWFPAGPSARAVEVVKAQLGHKHRCVIPEVPEGAEVFGTIGEHLLTLATLKPKINVPVLHQHVVDHGSEPYGYLLIQEK